MPNNANDKKAEPGTDEALAVLSAAHVKAFPEAHASDADKAARDLLREVTAVVRKAGFEVHEAEGVMVIKVGPGAEDCIRMSADSNGVHLASGATNAKELEDVGLAFDALKSVWAPVGSSSPPQAAQPNANSSRTQGNVNQANPGQPGAAGREGARTAVSVVAERLRDAIDKRRSQFDRHSDKQTGGPT